MSAVTFSLEAVTKASCFITYQRQNDIFSSRKYNITQTQLGNNQIDTSYSPKLTCLLREEIDTNEETKEIHESVQYERVLMGLQNAVSSY